MSIRYKLPGNQIYQERIYPNPTLLKPETHLRTYEEVIAHFTKSSLDQDGIRIQNGSLEVTKRDANAGYTISFEPLADFVSEAEQFAKMHVLALDENHGGLALAGADACQRTPAWNPMAGFPVNKSDGKSEWLPCLPLGMPIANHRAVTLLHYPPIIAYRNADYLKNNTLRRWQQLLRCVGMPQPELYQAILDVNPIAAPGSGESEYQNDYLPINLTSLFFDNDGLGLTYVRSMLDLMLNPPYTQDRPYTLPLLVCGSRLYDPQAAGWFRTRYKNCLPTDANGAPMANVLQAGLIRVFPNSRKETPYMIANHMIAAGVTGRCTGDPTVLPNIQLYEAQDLVAATFLTAYADGKKIPPGDALRTACKRWFGGPDGNRAPNPPDPEDRLAICALAQMDLCFDPVKIAPKYSYEEAKSRCREKGGENYCPCFGCD
jgi:hypothetical protein